VTQLDLAYRELRSAAERTATSGRPVIGIVGRDVPSLLVAAGGAMPFRLRPEEQSTDDADAIMGRAIDRSASLVLAALLSGALDFLTGLFVSHDSEASLRLFYSAQELHRRGRISVPVHLVDQVHLNRESSLRFNTHQLSLMCDAASAWTSLPIDARSLERARADLAAVRAELARVRDARRRDARRLSGLSALHAYAVAGAASAAEVLPVLRGVVDEVEAGGDHDDRLPVFLTGSAPIGDALYRAIEDAGAVVAGEDHDWGDPILSDRLPDSIPANREVLLRQLAQSRLDGAPASAFSSMAARAAHTRDGVLATGARALLSIVRDHDDAPAWDWRHQRDAAGVPGVMLRGPISDDATRIADTVAELRSAS